jgi:hypothetical protein
MADTQTIDGRRITEPVVRCHRLPVLDGAPLGSVSKIKQLAISGVISGVIDEPITTGVVHRQRRSGPSNESLQKPSYLTAK